MLRAVVIDSREPQWCQRLRFNGASVIVNQLSAGDAWLATDGATVVVERKALSDLCLSIADNRLINQAIEMRSVSPWAYVVVTGIPAVAGGVLVMSGQPSKWQWNSIQGALLTLQDLGVSVVWCDGDAQYGPTLEWLASRARGDVCVKARREAVLESPAEMFLSGLPGIATERARALLEHCGSPAWALDYLTGEDQFGDVPGIGKATRAGVRKVLGLDADMRLKVCMVDTTEREKEK